LAIISSYHQRIGLVTLRLNKVDDSLTVRIHYYNESNIDELSQKVWEKVTEFLLLHFKYLKNPSNLPTTDKKMERVFRRAKA
jgi:phenylacetate-coenzyme A ligase PaaK-like adenylate-forming protein